MRDVSAAASGSRHGRAIVIGGSMVGLAAARALSGSFREVVVIDRDRFPRELPAHRRGVPQSFHIHNLTLRGQREIEALFPGFVAEAVRLGARQIDHVADVAAFTNQGWEPRFESGFVALSATRMLLEFAQRERFRALVDNVRVLEATRVEDLVVEQRGDRLVAVGVRTDDPARPTLHADLVVDCSGRGARWKSWFQQRDVALPRETVVDSQCGYSSRFYRPRDPAEFDWKAMVVDVRFPEHPHWGVIVPLENDDWVVTLGGFNGHYPPADEEGFLHFARALPSAAYHQALERADPLSPVRTFRKLEMRWNHFERYHHPIQRFLALGDSCWAYNPLYGQGMSIGTTCAGILRDVLAENSELDTLPARFYPRAARFAYEPWQVTALMDMRWPGTRGKRPWNYDVLMPASQLFLHAAHYDRALYRAMLESIHLLRSPSALARPRILAGLAGYGIRRMLGALPAEDHGPLVPPRAKRATGAPRIVSVAE